ncbi:MAG: PAS domain S-box protein [candidate division NC10 bacterium]
MNPRGAIRGPKINILLIEDNPGDARLIREMLGEVRGASFAMEVASELPTGLQRLSAGGADVVLLDLSMPGSGGLDTFTKAHAQAGQVPIIVLTGLDDEAVAVRAVREGAQDYLIKGQVDSHLLGRAIRYAIERKRAEAALERLRHQNEMILDGAGEGIYGLDLHGNTTFVNPAAAKMIGWEIEELIGKPLHDILHHSKADGTPYSREECPIHAAFRDGAVHHATDEVFWRKDGKCFPVEYISTPIRDKEGMLLGAVVTFKNITERKRADESLRRAHDELERGVQERTAELSKAIGILEEQIAERHRVEDRLRRSEDQLRALSGHLRAVQEEERARIAREVHDELGQSLTALKIDLSWLSQRLAGERVELQTKIQTMTHLIDETIQAVRRIATELRPGVLDHLGLVAALEWQVREFQERTGLVCALKKSPDDLVLDTARATTVFRICQEALTNVARHAQATKVEISLKITGRKLALEVRDNGRGIPEHAVADPQSVGLMGMRERVLPWGGNIHIQGVEGKGTVVTVRLPIGDGDPQRPGGPS